MAAKGFAKQLRGLYVSEADRKKLLSLESVLVASYVRLFDHTDVYKTPGRRWHEIRKVEKLHIYEERSSGIPSIMMLGTFVGSLDDVMYGVVAATDRDESVKQKALRDGSEQNKVLSCLVEPTEQDPFRQVSVKWQQYSTRDYVCLDTTGFAESLSSSRMGYSLSQSVAFGNQVPHFDRYSIDRQ